MNYDVDYAALYEKEKQKGVSRAYSRFMLALFIFNVIAYAVMFSAELVFLITLGQEKSLELFNNIYVQWVLSVAPMYLISLPVLFLIVRGMKTVKREKKKLKAKDFFALLLICQALILVGSYIGSFINGILGSFLDKEIGAGATDLVSRSPLWLTFAVAVVIGPIVEEFIFRKLLIDRIGRFGDAAAIITSGIAFGLFHGNFEQFFYAILLGFVFAFVYTKTGNWLHSTLLHIAVNFLGSVIPLLLSPAMERVVEYMQSGAADSVTLQYVRDCLAVSSYTVLQYLSVAAGAFILIHAFSKKKINITKNSQIYLEKKQFSQCSVLNVGTILFLVATLAQFALNILF